MSGPQLLVAELEKHGWIACATGRGCVRLTWPGLTDRTALLVPTDPADPEFTDLWLAALDELEDAVAVGMQAARVIAEVTAALPAEVSTKRSEASRPQIEDHPQAY